MLKTPRFLRLFLLLGLLTVVMSFQSVTPAYAYSYVCSTVNRFTTGSGTGFGCDGALAAARVNAENKANAACQYGVCYFVVTSSTCSGNSATLNATYRCYNCVNGPCPF